MKKSALKTTAAASAFTPLCEIAPLIWKHSEVQLLPLFLHLTIFPLSVDHETQTSHSYPSDHQHYVQTLTPTIPRAHRPPTHLVPIMPAVSDYKDYTDSVIGAIGEKASPRVKAALPILIQKLHEGVS
jgi:hypothetical protein